MSDREGRESRVAFPYAALLLFDLFCLQSTRMLSEPAMAHANLTSIPSWTKDLNWPVLLLSILAVFGTLGNLLVCASISLDKQLQTVTNWFLFSLAIADCLVSLIVLPLSIIKDFQGEFAASPPRSEG